MLDPEKLVGPAAPPIRPVTMDEAGFLDYALTAVENTGLVCFLDSAGPITPRSRRSWISGRPLGIFFQYADHLVYWDLGGGRRSRLSLPAFSAWLDRFHGLGSELGGPALFSLLTYEAFNPFSAPAAPHPLWRHWQAVWLLCANHGVYDRESGTFFQPLDTLPERRAAGRKKRSPGQGWRESESDYRRKIRLIQEDIYEGRLYQANLSQRFLCATEQSPPATYAALRRRNPSPFMGIFRLGETWILSGSPERLLHKDGRRLSSRPIAGTKPRFDDPARDAASKRALCGSEKERAEHLMLLDLVRNDLGRVALPGSVRVEEYGSVESYSHVHHLVSEVGAVLRDGVGLVELIRALFPGGTITGAPKIACIQRLSALECEARGPYTGAIGYIDARGGMDLNILIRTLIQVGNRVCFHGGGGIVADSEQRSEYLETRQKCLALMEALGIRA